MQVTERYIIHTVGNVKQDVGLILREFYANRIAKASCIDPAYHELWCMISRLAFAGGKKTRPYLVILAYELYGGKHYQQVLPVAAAQELLHLALLMHDDITDKALIRYNTDNISGQYRKLLASKGADADDAQHYAGSAALLAGDLLLSSAYSMVLDSSISSDDKLLVQQILSDAIFDVAGGQLLDIEASASKADNLIGIEQIDVRKIARLKTASYSFVGPLKCGAVLAGAPVKEIERLVSIGLILGVAFQIADDLLSIFGDNHVTGKSNLLDLKEGKLTYLMQLTYQLASPQQLDIVKRYFGNSELTESQADDVREVIIACGARRQAVALVEKYQLQAKQMAGALHISETSKPHLDSLIALAALREY